MAKRAKAPRRSGETAYQRRIRLYKERHPGATTQEARGKRSREHVTRKQHEVERYGMPLSQLHAVDDFAREQAARRDGKHADPSEVIAKFRRQARDKGYDAFVKFRNTVRRMGRQKRVRAVRMLRKRGGGGGGGGGGTTLDFSKAAAARDRALADMYDAADDFFDDADDFDLAYYH